MSRYEDLLSRGRRTWIVSDTHLGHQNIIRYCDRPFADRSHMDEVLIARWNERVGPDDVVIHVGDFTFKTAADGTDGLLRRLNGSVILHRGNHDGPLTTRSRGWLSVERGPVVATVEGVRMRICHYADPEGDSAGVLDVHGHSHGTGPLTPGSLDVGVDLPWTRMGPVSVEEVVAASALQASRLAKAEVEWKSMRVKSGGRPPGSWRLLGRRQDEFVRTRQSFGQGIDHGPAVTVTFDRGTADVAGVGSTTVEPRRRKSEGRAGMDAETAPART